MLLYLECPCTSFPRNSARQYKETYQYPPPSTIYGMLLSLVGETDLEAHRAASVKVGIIGEEPPISRVLRRLRHQKFQPIGGDIGSSNYCKPDFQELLTDLRVVVDLDSSTESVSPTLEDRVQMSLINPELISRFGGLSLGESWALVNGVREYRESDGDVSWLVEDNRGLISLPVWVNRATDKASFRRYSLAK